MVTDAVREVGPASRSLGAILAVTHDQTFMSVANLAQRACLHVKTVRNHLVTLKRHGWIEKEPPNRSRRRTCTIMLTEKTKLAAWIHMDQHQRPWGVLPYWACFMDMPWCAEAVLQHVMSILMSCRKMASDEGIDVWDYIDDDRWRFRFSGRRLQKLTGLSRPAIARGKQWLADHGIVKLKKSKRKKADLLLPNRGFKVP